MTSVLLDKLNAAINEELKLTAQDSRAVEQHVQQLAQVEKTVAALREQITALMATAMNRKQKLDELMAARDTEQARLEFERRQQAEQCESIAKLALSEKGTVGSVMLTPSEIMDLKLLVYGSMLIGKPAVASAVVDYASRTFHKTICECTCMSAS